MNYRRKSKIPFEIANAKEWDPNKHLRPQLDDDQDDDDEESRVEEGSMSVATSRTPQTSLSFPPDNIQKDDDGFQTVVRRFKNNPKASTSTTVRGPLAVATNAMSQRKAVLTINAKDVAKPGVKVQTPVNKSSLSHTDFKARPEIQSKPSPSIVKPPAVKIEAQPAINRNAGQAPVHTTLNTNAPALGKNSLPSKPPDRPNPFIHKMFNFEKDNTAKVAFRQRQEAPGKFQLHKNIIEIEPDPVRLQRVLHDIGTRCESFIRPPQSSNDFTLLIWGNEKQVRKSEGSLRSWIHELESVQTYKSGPKEKFAVVHSVIGPNHKAQKKETAKKDTLSRFQQNPDPLEAFEYGSIYQWPIEEVSAQELFGSNLEAFDGLRYAFKTHIVFDDALGMIRLYSNTDGAVSRLLKLFEGTLREFQARGALSCQPKSVILVDVSRCQSTNMVRLHQHTSGSTTQHIPILEPDLLNMGLDGDWRTKTLKITQSHTKQMRQALQYALSHLKSFRGHVRIRLHIGTFALTKFRWPRDRPPSIPLEHFLENMEQTGTSGTLVRSLYSQNKASDVMNMILHSADLFEPLHGLGKPLGEVTPTYGARFEIRRFEKPALQLEVDLSSNDDGLYYSPQSQWSNLDQKENNPPLNIFTVRLGSNPSWKLQISRENLFDTLRFEDNVKQFAESVKFDAKIPRKGAEIDGRKLITWEMELPGCLKPSIFEQKIAFRYRVKHMQGAVFEIARYDSYDLASNAQKPSVTTWGASLWHTEWDMILSENADLRLGEKAKWNPRIDTFFPGEQPHAANNLKQQQGIHPGLARFLRGVEPIAQRLGEHGQGGI